MNEVLEVLALILIACFGAGLVLCLLLGPVILLIIGAIKLL
jgi:hypothetical protein